MLQEIQEEGTSLQEVSEAMIAFENQHLEVVYQTQNSHLAERGNGLTLRFFDQSIDFTLCEFFTFRKRIKNIDLLELMSSEAPDATLVPLPQNDRFLLLSLRELLEIRDLLSGAWTMLELNTILHKEIYRK